MEEVYLSIKILLCGISLMGLCLIGSGKLKSKSYMYVLIFSLITSIIFCIMICIPPTEYTILKLIIYIMICILIFLEGCTLVYFIEKLVYYCSIILIYIVIGTPVGLMLLYIFICYAFSEDPDVKKIRTTYEIVSVNDSFSIGSGGSPYARYIYGIEEYKYYYKLDDEEESFKLGSIPADRTKIKYIEEGETPHIDIIDEVCENTIKWREYELYVPKNSIKDEYVFDIK